MAELSNDQLLVSAAGSVVDAGDIRIAPPLAGEAAYSLETPEDVAGYGSEHGAALELAGDGLELESPELEDYLLIDIETGVAYSSGAGWKVVASTDLEGAGLDPDDSAPAELAQFAEDHAVGAPTAPSNVLDLEGLPFESVVSLS